MSEGVRRREVLAMLGLAAAGWGAGLATPVSRASALCATATMRWRLLGQPMRVHPTDPRAASGRPRGSGLVVVYDEGPGTIVPSLDAVRLVDGSLTPHPLAIEEIGDSLAVLRIAPDLAPGDYTLRGVGRGESTMTITADALTGPPAPRTRRLRHERPPPAGPDALSSGTTRLWLVLAEPLAAGITLVAEWREGETSRATWAVPGTSPVTEVELASTGDCSGHGTFPPRGASITVRAIDALGMIGPPSRALRVPR